jgi:hypothetical protein
MRSTALLLTAAFVGAVLSVVFVLVTGTGAPGLYGALLVSLGLGIGLLAWHDRRERRHSPHR